MPVSKTATPLRTAGIGKRNVAGRIPDNLVAGGGMGAPGRQQEIRKPRLLRPNCRQPVLPARPHRIAGDFRPAATRFPTSLPFRMNCNTRSWMDIGLFNPQAFIQFIFGLLGGTAPEEEQIRAS